jgi:hypothetical protein
VGGLRDAFHERSERCREEPASGTVEIDPSTAGEDDAGVGDGRAVGGEI